MTCKNKDKKIRYCSECGTIGAIPAGKQNCCLSAHENRGHQLAVPYDVAIQAHAGFHAAAGLHRARQAIADANTVGLKVVDTE